MKRWARWLPPAFALALLGLSLYPLWATGYGVRVLLQLFMWIALAQSWNLMSGLTGYVSIGHVAFFGTVSYACAILAFTTPRDSAVLARTSASFPPP